VQSVDANLDQLQAIAPAAQVWQSRKIKLPAPKAASVQSAPAATPSLTTAQQLANQAMTANYSVHSSTGVDKLHAAGLFGKGVKIGSLDTGIDYTVPAVGPLRWSWEHPYLL
jgi:subtilisin family serine protease